MIWPSRAKKTPVKTPAKGENWYIEDESPWPPDTTVVRILDVKDGWVRYWINDKLPDNRMGMDMFLDCFKKVDNDS